MKFSSDKANIFTLLLDSSGSMEEHVENVRKGIRMYKDSFEDFPEANSISVSICRFDYYFYGSEFKKVSDLNLNYSADGGTELYFAINKAAEELNNYVEEIVKEKGIKPKITFIVFSDGLSDSKRASFESAKKTIEKLNYAGATTVFIAFGDAIDSKCGKEMGFLSTIDVENKENLVNFLGVELSKSCKEQSRSMKALGANFFSKAVEQSASQGYSSTAKQVLDDVSWINDI